MIIKVRLIKQRKIFILKYVFKLSIIIKIYKNFVIQKPNTFLLPISQSRIKSSKPSIFQFLKQENLKDLNITL
jgi:hypothetical protein